MVDVDILVGNNTLIDIDLYQAWLAGHSGNEAACVLQNRGLLQQYGISFDTLLSDVQNHYRTFVMLERLLQQPPKLAEQLTFQLTPETQKAIIENYYKFDASVIRELLGKKLTSRNRKDLDDVMEKTRIPLRSCRRQFDNIKRVFKTVEEMKGSLEENIKTHYLLSDELASPVTITGIAGSEDNACLCHTRLSSRQYAAVIFITNQRFETGKKKLQHLTFEDFAYCANEMILNWSYSSKDCPDHEDMDVDLDREFLRDLRDLRPLCDKEEHRILVLSKLQGRVSDSTLQDVDRRFFMISKILVGIAYGLNHSKEVRDLFIDLVEKFIEPCKATGWKESDAVEFLKAYKTTAEQIDFMRPDKIHNVWERYMNTITRVILRMFPGKHFNTP